MSLYDLLGVGETAGVTEIHAAYRNAVRSAHPDVGGDAEAFVRLKLAHDVLTDPDRRRRYDQTGEFEQNQVDNAQAELLTMLAGAFGDACNGVLQAQEKLTQVDLVQRMRVALELRAKAIRHQITEATQATDLFTELLGRFSTATVDQANLMETIVRQKIAAAAEFRIHAAADIARIENAAAFLGAYRYRADPVPQQSPYMFAPGTSAAQEFMTQILQQQRARG